LKKNGLNAVPSQGNFVFVWFEKESVKEKVFSDLLNAGILICNLKVFGQSRSLRIGVGGIAETSELVSLVGLK
jgi:histidinol-phosphate/aromatic aminotransferase/cobyric acid decarboxylase-like protein